MKHYLFLFFVLVFFSTHAQPLQLNLLFNRSLAANNTTSPRVVQADTVFPGVSLDGFTNFEVNHNDSIYFYRYKIEYYDSLGLKQGKLKTQFDTLSYRAGGKPIFLNRVFLGSISFIRYYRSMEGLMDSINMRFPFYGKLTVYAGRDSINPLDSVYSYFYILEENTIKFIGVEESSFDISAFKSYPNPVKEVLHVSLPGKMKNATYTIHTQEGKVKMSGFLNQHTSLNLNQLPNGMYFLSVQPENGKQFTQTFIKK